MHSVLAQLLEVRAHDRDALGVTITVDFGAEACAAIRSALSDQLARRSWESVETPEQLSELRRLAEVLDRLDPPCRGGVGARLALSHDELKACLLELAAYTARADAGDYQPPELRERLRVLADVGPVLWDASAAASAAALALP